MEGRIRLLQPVHTYSIKCEVCGFNFRTSDRSHPPACIEHIHELERFRQLNAIRDDKAMKHIAADEDMKGRILSDIRDRYDEHTYTLETPQGWSVVTFHNDRQMRALTSGHKTELAALFEAVKPGA